MITEHSRLPPSSAERWVECSGSIVLQEEYPETEDSEDSREGTASHWVASNILEKVKIYSGWDDQLGLTAPNGVIITQEMIDCAMEYVDDVVDTCSKVGIPVSDLHVEERIFSPIVHAESWGTPDAWLFDKVRGILYVWDYKYGHRVVHAYDNWQLVNYTLGILPILFKEREPEISIDMRVVQPRSYNHGGTVRSWKTRPNMLRAFVNRLQSAAIEALGDDPKTVSGNWCRDCTARHVCRTRQESAMIAVDIIGDLSADVLSPLALGLELQTLERAAKSVESRLKALKAQALETIRGGTGVPFFEILPNYGKQIWNRPTPQVFAMGDLFEKDLRKDQEPCTPKQAIAKGIDEAVIKQYSTVPNKGLKLVPVDAMNVKRVFEKL